LLDCSRASFLFWRYTTTYNAKLLIWTVLLISSSQSRSLFHGKALRTHCERTSSLIEAFGSLGCAGANLRDTTVLASRSLVNKDNGSQKRRRYRSHMSTLQVAVEDFKDESVKQADLDEHCQQLRTITKHHDSVTTLPSAQQEHDRYDKACAC